MKNNFLISGRRSTYYLCTHHLTWGKRGLYVLFFYSFITKFHLKKSILIWKIHKTKTLVKFERKKLKFFYIWNLYSGSGKKNIAPAPLKNKWWVSYILSSPCKYWYINRRSPKLECKFIKKNEIHLRFVLM